jgi:hypothetical protein
LDNVKANFPEIEELLNENPDLKEFLELYGETLETYQKTLEAMGESTEPAVASGSTTSTDDLDLAASSTDQITIIAS